MPPISPMKPLLQVIFYSKQLKLPTGWSDNKPNEKDKKKHYEQNSHPDGEKAWPPKLIPPWFTPASSYKLHVETCDKIGKEFKKFAEDAVDAVKFSHSMWKLQAKFKDLKVNAVTALGTPGCLDGPELESNIKNAPMMMAYAQGNAKKYRDAVAKGVSGQYKKWQGKVMVPGLPWYPAFAAFPGPMAPPMPNVPTPLIACPSAMMAEIVVPKNLGDAMTKALDKSMKDEDPDKQHEALFEAIGTVLALAFLMWMPQQQVMLVMGKGPIPSFAPPYVPVGPVVMGDNIAAPGHLMT